MIQLCGHLIKFLGRLLKQLRVPTVLGLPCAYDDVVPKINDFVDDGLVGVDFIQHIRLGGGFDCLNKALALNFYGGITGLHVIGGGLLRSFPLHLKSIGEFDGFIRQFLVFEGCDGGLVGSLLQLRKPGGAGPVLLRLRKIAFDLGQVRPRLVQIGGILCERIAAHFIHGLQRPFRNIFGDLNLRDVLRLNEGGGRLDAGHVDDGEPTENQGEQDDPPEADGQFC